MNVIIAGITSDIGKYICDKYIKKGYSVSGTYRKLTDSDLKERIESSGGKLYYCDFSDRISIDDCVNKMNADGISWDILISAVGIMSPIKQFIDVDIDEWEKNIYINAISQMRLLRGVLVARRSNAAVYFMTSKGINDTFPEHSAYCISKIMLIKMCELLDDEIGDCRFIAFNPGFIPTKIINQEPKGFTSKGQNTQDPDYSRTELEKVWNFIDCTYGVEKRVISGRNYFVKYDDWENKAFYEFLMEKDDTYKLRRSRDSWNG